MVDFNLKSWRVVVVVAVISAHSSSANFYSFDGNNFSLNFINITRPRKNRRRCKSYQAITIDDFIDKRSDVESHKIAGENFYWLKIC